LTTTTIVPAVGTVTLELTANLARGVHAIFAEAALTTTTPATVGATLLSVTFGRTDSGTPKREGATRVSESLLAAVVPAQARLPPTCQALRRAVHQKLETTFTVVLYGTITTTHEFNSTALFKTLAANTLGNLATDPTIATTAVRTTCFIITIGLTIIHANAVIGTIPSHGAVTAGAPAAVGPTLLLPTFGGRTTPTALLNTLFYAQVIPHYLATIWVHITNTILAKAAFATWDWSDLAPWSPNAHSRLADLTFATASAKPTTAVRTTLISSALR